MSIPCNNRIVCRCENHKTLEKIKQRVESNYSDFIDIETNEEGALYFNLDHDYGFPARMMTQMTADINDDTLNISVLTYDQGHEYLAHHQYKNNKWGRLYESNPHPIVERLEHHTKH